MNDFNVKKDVENYPAGKYPKLVTMIKTMLNKNPDLRPTYSEIIEYMT